MANPLYNQYRQPINDNGLSQIIEQAKEYKPSDRLNTYQLTRTALENLLPTLIESYDIAMVRASLDKLAANLDVF